MSEQNASTPQPAAVDKDALRKASGTHVERAESAVKRGEKGYAEAYLVAGYHADCAVSLRLQAGDTRKAAIQTVEATLSRHSSTAVNGNDLIGCWHAYRLLQDGGVDDTQAALTRRPDFDYSHYRIGWKQLVDRVDKGKAEERWVLLPSLEADCKAAYAKAAENCNDRDAVVGVAKALVAKHAQKLADAAKVIEEQAAKEKAVKQQEAREAAEKERKAREAEEAAKKAAEKKPDDEMVRKAAEQAEHMRKQLEKDRMDKQRESQKATADAAKAERERREAQGKQIDAEAKRKAAEQKKLERGDTPATRAEAPRPAQPTHIGAAKAASSPQDVADLMVDMVEKSGKDSLSIMRHYASKTAWSPKLAGELLKGIVASESLVTLRAMRDTLNMMKLGDATTPAAVGAK